MSASTSPAKEDSPKAQPWKQWLDHEMAAPAQEGEKPWQNWKPNTENPNEKPWLEWNTSGAGDDDEVRDDRPTNTACSFFGE